MRMAAGRGDDVLTKQKRAVSPGHRWHDVAENLSRIVIGPVVQDGAKEIDTCAVDRLRRKKVMFLVFNTLETFSMSLARKSA